MKSELQIKTKLLPWVDSRYKFNPTCIVLHWWGEPCQHAKCANASAIGIEIEGNDERDLDHNEKQFQSVVALVHYLKETFHIADTFTMEQIGSTQLFYGITSHKQVDKLCQNGSGKIDVHDQYVERVLTHVKRLANKG